MARKRKKIYQAKDKVTFTLPENPDPKLLKIINAPTNKFLSPLIVKVLTQYAQEQFPSNKRIDESEVGKIILKKKDGTGE